MSGQVSLPENREYQYAVQLVTIGKELCPSARRMLEIYTGYDASTLEALGHESADAISDAVIALYGRPCDLV